MSNGFIPFGYFTVYNKYLFYYTLFRNRSFYFFFDVLLYTVITPYIASSAASSAAFLATNAARTAAQVFIIASVLYTFLAAFAA